MAINNYKVTMYTDSHQELEFTLSDVTSLIQTEIVWEMSTSVEADPVIQKVTEDMTIVDNVFTVHILPSDNVDLKPGIYIHEARVTDFKGQTRPVAYGEIEVVDTLTESEG